MQKSPARRRRWAVLTAITLVAGLVPALFVTPAASAVEPCPLETEGTLLPPSAGCDDALPPDTEITSISPAPNANNYVKTDSVTFKFAAVADPSDPGPYVFQCRLDDGAWAPCASPKTYTDLADSKTGYNFQVYAVDERDAAITWSGAPFSGASETAPDDDSATPAERSFKVDTTAPNSFIFDKPYDELRPELPMVTSRNISLRLDSSESAANTLKFVCTLDGASVPCQQGATELSQLKPGDRRFTAAAIDLAGNRDTSPATTQFAVPLNLLAAKGSGWRRVQGSGYFAGDYLEARKVGTRLVTKSLTMTELRLIAPAGPNLGVIDIQIGKGIHRKIKLNAPSYERFKVYVIRDEYAPKVTGRITIRVRALGGHKVARIDALLAH